MSSACFLELGDHRVGDAPDAELLLRPRQRNPQPPPRPELPVGENSCNISFEE
jgi:hypothetical protein